MANAFAELTLSQTAGHVRAIQSGAKSLNAGLDRQLREHCLRLTAGLTSPMYTASLPIEERASAFSDWMAVEGYARGLKKTQ